MVPGPPSVDTSERPLVLVWEVTQACELACDHCRASAEPARHPDELTTGAGKRLLERARDFGENQIVVLSGGDPLARDDLTELVAHGDELGLRMALTPSGTTRLTPERVRRLVEAGVDRLALSIDGAGPAAHDDFRGEAGSFVETLRAARTVAATDDCSLQINTTVCRATADDLPGIAELVAALDAGLWSVFFLVQVGRGRVLDPVSPGRSDRIMSWLVDVVREAPFAVKTTEAPHYRRVAIQDARRGDGGGGGDTREGGEAEENGGEDGGNGGATDRPAPRPGIRAGDGFAFVSHTGEIYPSGFLPQSAGRVPDDDLVQTYRSAPLFESLRDPDSFGGKCGVCPYREVCGGSRSRAFAATGDPLASDPLCPFVPPDYDGPLPARQRSTEGSTS